MTFFKKILLGATAAALSYYAHTALVYAGNVRVCEENQRGSYSAYADCYRRYGERAPSRQNFNRQERQWVRDQNIGYGYQPVRHGGRYDGRGWHHRPYGRYHRGHGHDGGGVIAGIAAGLALGALAAPRQPVYMVPQAPQWQTEPPVWMENPYPSALPAAAPMQRANGVERMPENSVPVDVSEELPSVETPREHPDWNHMRPQLPDNVFPEDVKKCGEYYIYFDEQRQDYRSEYQVLDCAERSWWDWLPWR